MPLFEHWIIAILYVLNIHDAGPDSPTKWNCSEMKKKTHTPSFEWIKSNNEFLFRLLYFFFFFVCAVCQKCLCCFLCMNYISLQKMTWNQWKYIIRLCMNRISLFCILYLVTFLFVFIRSTFMFFLSSFDFYIGFINRWILILYIFSLDSPTRTPHCLCSIVIIKFDF